MTGAVKIVLDDRSALYQGDSVFFSIEYITIRHQGKFCYSLGAGGFIQLMFSPDKEFNQFLPKTAFDLLCKLSLQE